MQRKLWIVAFLIGSCVHFAEAEKPKPNACQVKLGGHDVIIPLRTGPNAWEPLCQPERIRVKDRAEVTVHVVGVSPTEVCSITASAPTPTVMTNPLSAAINSLAGLKFFDFESGSPAMTLSAIKDVPFTADWKFTPDLSKPKTQAEKDAAEKKKKDEEAKKEQDAADKAAYDQYRELATHVTELSTPVQTKQKKWQKRYTDDLDAIALYLTTDYRGAGYINFKPKEDAKITQAETDSKIPATLSSDIDSPPTEMDYQPLQSLYDQMKLMQPRIVTACTTAGKRCNLAALKDASDLLDTVNAYLLAAGDNLKTLQAAQVSEAAAYAALHKIVIDYDDRIKNKKVITDNNQLVELIPLGPDYTATDPRVVSCSTDAAAPVATTDGIAISVLYQNFPALTLSAGVLTTFLQKQEIGTTPLLDSNGTTYTTYFAVTDTARASVFPMAFVNYRVTPPALKHWWGQPESEMALANNISAGIGVNPNTGTNQVEFFAGDAIGFGPVFIHLGLHYGRTESLGGNFTLNKPVPTGFSGSAPINWSYHPAFSIGFSVRTAPFQ